MQPALAASKGAAVARTMLPDLAVLDKRLLQPAMAHHSSSHRSDVRACCHCICRNSLPDYVTCVPSVSAPELNMQTCWSMYILFTHQRNPYKHNLAISIPLLSITSSNPI